MSTRLRRIIAWWQVVCGILGLLVSAAMYFDWLPGGRALLEGSFGWINYYAGIGFYSFTIAAGCSLLRDEDWGLWASAACQAVQVFSIALLHGPHVQIAAGPILGVTILSPGALRMSAGFNSAFFLGTRVSGPTFELSVNFIAATWAILLGRAAVRPRPKPSFAAA